jgi:threonine aldolase
MAVHDFRSDTVTLPTPAMMAAIAGAPLGDAARSDDPTVNALEARAAEITGKEATLFLPSGTMANLCAVIAHDCWGGEVIVEETAHIFNSEGGGLSCAAGAIPRPVKGEHGQLDPAAVLGAIRSGAELHVAPTKLICLENTHNASGGLVMQLETMAAIHETAKRAGIPVHLDGARLFNAAVHLGVPVGAICTHTDSVWFALCKGLGGPAGSVLAGDAAFILKARRAAKMLGGAMRQAGLIAAPAMVALEEPYDRLKRDHDMARLLALGLAEIDPSLVDAGRVQTNIVNCFVDRFAGDAAGIRDALRQRGILANSKKTKIRFVTHCHIDESAVAAAVAGFAEVIEPLRKAA